MKIRLIGQRNTQGIGNHFANFCDRLKDIYGIKDFVEEIDFEDFDRLQQAKHQSQPDDINISFVAMNIHEHFLGKNIQWIVGESTRVPEHIMSVLKPADQVWVPSTWGQDILIKNGLPASQIEVVNEGVDSNLYHAHGRQMWSGDRPFRFLTVGKYELRKSIDETLQAFAQSFGNTPGVELIIKSGYFTNADQKFKDLTQKIEALGLKNVQVLWGNINPEEIVNLYRSCDVFVFPTKGEGWGLPLIEAAASGMPIITVPYSAHMEFLQYIMTSVLSVDYVMTPIDCPEYQSYYPDSTNNWGEWARPDPYNLAQALRQSYHNYIELFNHAQHNSRIIRSRFDWNNSVEQALTCLLG